MKSKQMTQFMVAIGIVIFGIFLIRKGADVKQSDRDTASVAICKNDISSGSVVHSNDVAFKRIRKENLPTRPIRRSDMDKYYGKIIKGDIGVGEIFLETDF